MGAPPPPTKSSKSRVVDDSDDEPLIDTTQFIPLKSKKTSRLRRKADKKAKISAAKPHLHTLPNEIILEILTHLLPRDIIRYRRTNRHSNTFVQEHVRSLAGNLISFRYSNLAKCFPLPRLLNTVDPSLHEVLLNPSWQDRLKIHRLPYQHIETDDKYLTCSCLACVLAWNNLCLVVDLSYWMRKALIPREVIPMIPRGTNPQWNKDLVASHAEHVRLALTSPLAPLWYAHLLQTHLETTIAGIQRFVSKRDAPRFALDEADVRGGTDAFCARSGPPNYEFPHHRDTYYAPKYTSYLPNRIYRDGEWRYIPANQHEVDLARVTKGKVLAKRDFKEELAQLTIAEAEVPAVDCPQDSLFGGNA